MAAGGCDDRRDRRCGCGCGCGCGCCPGGCRCLRLVALRLFWSVSNRCRPLIPAPLSHPPSLHPPLGSYFEENRAKRVGKNLSAYNPSSSSSSPSWLRPSSSSPSSPYYSYGLTATFAPVPLIPSGTNRGAVPYPSLLPSASASSSSLSASATAAVVDARLRHSRATLERKRAAKVSQSLREARAKRKKSRRAYKRSSDDGMSGWGLESVVAPRVSVCGSSHQGCPALRLGVFHFSIPFPN